MKSAAHRVGVKFYIGTTVARKMYIIKTEHHSIYTTVYLHAIYQKLQYCKYTL